MTSPIEGFISNIKPRRVSLVKHPANEREFLLFKSEEKTMDELLRIVSETEAANESSMIEVLKSRGYDEDAITAVAAAARVLSAYADQVDADGFKELAKSLGFASEEEEANITKSELEQLDPVARQKVNELMKARAQDEKRLAVLEEKIAKAASDEKRRAVSEKVADVELPEFDNDALVDVLVTLEAESADLIVDGLTKATNIVKSSEVFTEIGSSNESEEDPSDDPFTKIDKLAEELAKSADISYGDAMDRVMSENPELAVEYLNKTRRVN